MKARRGDAEDNRKACRETGSTVSGFLALILATAACQVALISQYDEQTDKSVTDLHKEVERCLVALVTRCVYEHHKSFYQEGRADLGAIRVRAQAIPNNDRTVEQLALLAIASTNPAAQQAQGQKRARQELPLSGRASAATAELQHELYRDSEIGAGEKTR
jgi:hypothetical protein